MTPELWFIFSLYCFTATISGITGFGAGVLTFGLVGFFLDIDLRLLFPAITFAGQVKTFASVPVYRKYIDWKLLNNY